MQKVKSNIPGRKEHVHMHTCSEFALANVRQKEDSNNNIFVPKKHSRLNVHYI